MIESVLHTIFQCLGLLECTHEYIEQRDGISCTFRFGAASDLVFWRDSVGTKVQGKVAGKLYSRGKEFVMSVGYSKET